MPVNYNHFPKIAGQIGPASRETLQEASGRARDKWKATTKVDTGEHRDSIHTEYVSDTEEAIVADTDHSYYVEMGARGVAGDHAGVQALTDVAREMGGIMTNKMRA